MDKRSNQLHWPAVILKHVFYAEGSPANCRDSIWRSFASLRMTAWQWTGLLLLTLFLLNGCSTVSYKDGPPSSAVDESKIPDAVPKNEALSKSGNKNTYRVFGKRYYTLKSSRNYEAQGIASWYGKEFHTIRTSSGERYNMLAMTAAHKTLPLPTYVQVTNLANGKKVIVKVNDRGPFAANRLIDVSYVAAKKLGMIGHGTTHVNVKAVDPDDYNKQVLAGKTPVFAINTKRFAKSSHHLSHVKHLASAKHFARHTKMKQRTEV